MLIQLITIKNFNEKMMLQFYKIKQKIIIFFLYHLFKTFQNKTFAHKPIPENNITNINSMIQILSV